MTPPGVGKRQTASSCQKVMVLPGKSMSGSMRKRSRLNCARISGMLDDVAHGWGKLPPWDLSLRPPKVGNQETHLRRNSSSASTKALSTCSSSSAILRDCSGVSGSPRGLYAWVSITMPAS